MAGVDDEFRAPLGVTHEDDDPDGFVKVVAVIPDFDVSSKMTLKGKKIVPAGGSTVDVEFKEQSLLMNANVKDKKKKETKYRLKYRKLPDKIDPDESYYKLKKGQVIIHLKKEENRSWVSDLSAHGLEMDPLD